MFQETVSSRLQIRLLGEFQFLYDGQPIAGLHADRPQSLFAFLLLHRGVPQPRRHLAYLLWPDSTEGQARTNLRNLWHTLRQLLPDADAYLLSDSATIQWQRQADYDLDVARFEAALQEASRAEDAATVRQCLETAVSLYQGDLLPGNYDDWLIPIREELLQRYLAALRQLITLLEDQQEVRTAAHYCQRLLQHDPFDETAAVLLMRLQALSGDRTGVRRTYQTLTTVLRRELGVDPAATTQETYLQLLRLEPMHFAPGDTAPKGWQPSPIPVPATPFIGREKEVADVVRRLLDPDCRLLTIIGLGGIGKTRLSLQVAAELQDAFADGVFFVPLASLSDPQLLVSPIARQLDIREGGGQPLLQILKSTLQEKQLLLVLDNFEQIVAAAPILAELLASAPRLKLLVTSRTLLRLQGEYEYLVPPMKLPDLTQACSFQLLCQSEAVKLFVERAQATFTGFTLTAENAPIVAEICHRLDGIPLAIELAAARVKLLPPQALLTRLSHRLKVLTGGPQDVPTRQQTLRNTIDWSYSLLNPTEQALFSRLAVFVGGFTLETAEVICSSNNLPAIGFSSDTAEPEWDMLEGVTSLLNNSLLVQQGNNNGQSRFKMLETIREYALERLVESGQLESLQQEHATYFADQLDQIGQKLHFYSGLRLDWAEEEHDNLRAMLAWSLAKPGEVELGLRMVGVLYWFWYQRSYLSEGQAWCRRFTALIDKTRYTVGHASFLMGSGSLALWQGDMVEAGQCLQDGIAIFRELGDERRLAITLLGRGVLALYQGDTAVAQAKFEESLAIGKRLELWWIIGDSLLNLGNVAIAQGNYKSARNWLEQAETVAKSHNERWLMANVLNNLGELARIQGDYEQARTSYEESQTLFQSMKARSDVARALHNLGFVALHQLDYEQAAANFKEGLNIFQELGNKRGMAECLAGLAGLAIRQDRPQQAVRLLAAAESQICTSGASWWPADQVEYERSLALIQAALDQETFVVNWDEGQAISLSQAISDAFWLPI